MPLYFINPKKSTRRRKKLTGAAKAAFLRRMAKGRKKKKGVRPTRAKRTRRVVSTPRHGENPMAKRKRARKGGTRKRRRRPVARKVTRRRRRRVSVARRRPSGRITFRRVRGSVYKRNPGGLSVGSAIATLKQGVKDAAAVVAGEAVVNYVGRKLADKVITPTDSDGTKQAKTLAMRAALAIGVGVVARRIAGGDVARFAVAGALSSPIKTAARSVIPATSDLYTALMGDDELGAYYDALGAYPGEAVGSIGAGDGIGDVVDGSPDGMRVMGMY